MEIEKAYFTLAEILERWAISQADLVYLAENDRLRLSVRVFGLPLEFGDHEVDDHGTHRMPFEHSTYSGLLDLHARDAFELFRVGALTVAEFRTSRAAYASIRGNREGIVLSIGDLLLRRDERDRFEAETRFAGAAAAPPMFSASADYQQVRLGEYQFRLGPIQAEVVRALHTAAGRGQAWQSGKAILSAAGSKSLKMSDVFKSQPHWRELIESDDRGAYRLICR